VQNLSFKYPDGKNALENISFEVYQRESVAIIGPNGAGKSTLLLHLNGSLGIPENGKPKIKIAEINLTRKNLKEIRKNVGVVFQNPDDQLFMPSVFDDVAFGPINLGYPDSIVREKVAKALEEVGLAQFERRASYHLSYGEKKLISIATIISMDPKLVVLDEPTSGLDPRGKRRIMQILKKMVVTKIIATHDLEVAYELCNRAILINNGVIVAIGDAEDIIENEQLMLENGLETPLSIVLSRKVTW
jgi:cobalt/nickel transport system ATP-binding protein